MNLVHEKTDVILNVFIEQIKSKPQSWRVISVEFQNCDTIHSPLFQNLCLKNLHHFFGQTDAKLFWLKPNFLLIFFQGRAMPIEKCLEQFLKETEFKGFGRFFDILDLSIDWTDFMVLTNRMITPDTNSTKTPTAMETNQQSIEVSNTSGFEIELSPTHIKQLKSLRSARKYPLILLVEDDPFTLQLVRLALKADFEVIAAETARQALVYYQRHLPNMVFLDIQLPDGNGMNLLKQMAKADDESYIVMLSSHAQEERILECLKSGAKGFIAKPFTRKSVVDATNKFQAVRDTINGGNNRHGT